MSNLFIDPDFKLNTCDYDLLSKKKKKNRNFPTFLNDWIKEVLNSDVFFLFEFDDFLNQKLALVLWSHFNL